MAGAIGWPVAEQRLIYAGKALEDKRTLGGSGVLNNSKLRLQKPSVRPSPLASSGSTLRVRVAAMRHEEHCVSLSSDETLSFAED